MSYTIIFDTETTGIEPEDRIIQYGAVIVDEKGEPYKGNLQDAVFDGLCTSDTPIKLKAMATHNIRQKDIEGMPRFVETDFYKVLQELNNQNNYLIAHNLPFDLGMLEKEGFESKFKLIDTLQCSKHLFKKSKDENVILDSKNNFTPDHQLQTFRYKLFSKEAEDKEAAKYGVSIQAHNAIGDVIILKMFLKKLRVNVAHQFLNLVSIADIIDKAEQTLEKLVELTNAPVDLSDDLVNIGMFKGNTYRQLLSLTKADGYSQNGKDWLDWYYGTKLKERQTGTYVDNDLIITLEKLLGK